MFWKRIIDRRGHSGCYRTGIRRLEDGYPEPHTQNRVRLLSIWTRERRMVLFVSDNDDPFPVYFSRSSPWHCLSPFQVVITKLYSYLFCPITTNQTKLANFCLTFCEEKVPTLINSWLICFVFGPITILINVRFTPLTAPTEVFMVNFSLIKTRCQMMVTYNTKLHTVFTTKEGNKKKNLYA